MKANFYTVKFQFPLLWKLFFATVISVSFAIMTLPNLRKAIYHAIPIKLVAVHLNSYKEKDVNKSIVDLLDAEDGSIYAVDRYNIIKYSDSTIKTELSRDEYLAIGNGKYQALNTCYEYDNVLYAGDWNGGFYSKHSGSWKKVFQSSNKKARIRKIFKNKNYFYLVSVKGVSILDLQFKLLKTELEGEYIYDSVSINNDLYVLTGKNVLKLTDEKFISVHARTKSPKLSKLSKTQGELLILSNKGALFLEKNGSLSPGFLPNYLIDNYTSDGVYEVATVYKQGFFIRKTGSKWIQFPSPGRSKSRTSGLCIKDGILWAAFYNSGLFKIDIKRLLELEGEL